MWTEIWENVPDGIITALTITGKGSYKILPKDQFEAIYRYRTFAYSGDTLKNRFNMILYDNSHIIFSLKNLGQWLEKLTNHINWARAETIIETSDNAGLTTTVDNSTAVTKEKSNYLGFTKGDNNVKNKQKVKGGSTDSNSYDDENNGEYLNINENDDEDKYPTMKAYNVSNHLDKNQINDIALQLNNTMNDANNTSTSNSTGLSKNTNKSDSVKLNFNTAENLLAIINMKIPELRRLFYSKFESLFISVY